MFHNNPQKLHIFHNTQGYKDTVGNQNFQMGSPDECLHYLDDFCTSTVPHDILLHHTLRAWGGVGAGVGVYAVTEQVKTAINKNIDHKARSIIQEPPVHV